MSEFGKGDDHVLAPDFNGTIINIIILLETEKQTGTEKQNSVQI